MRRGDLRFLRIAVRTNWSFKRCGPIVKRLGSLQVFLKAFIQIQFLSSTQHFSEYVLTTEIINFKIIAFNIDIV